jgi:light-regulated signal transduction histidine kinase (bacteriophytochrome)
MNAEEELKQHKAHLEELVNERTRALENSSEQFKALARELETFSYSISHNLKAPLRAISGYAGMLKEDYSGSLDEEGNRLLNVINENAVKMGQLIEDILTYSRVGRKSLEKTKIDMNKLADEICSELRQGCPERKIDFQVKKVPDCNGDRRLIKQILINIISNAIKFAKVRNEAAIEIGSRKIDDKETYYIKDNGVGYDIKYADKMFGLFQRLHSTKEFEGTGVGLAIVQRLVNRHGGKIWTEAKPDEGATFYFTL